MPEYTRQVQRSWNMLPARMVVLVLVASVPSFAWAEPKLPVNLGEGFALVEVKDSFGRPHLHVRKDELQVRIDRSRRRVTLDLANHCNLAFTQTWTYDWLGALVENANAYRLGTAAALGFARAVALDPTWSVPSYNLASADMLLGDQEAAAQALAPWLAKEPIGTYVLVSTRRDLAPLLARPEFQVIRAKQPGTVTLTADGFPGKVAVTADGALPAPRCQS